MPSKLEVIVCASLAPPTQLLISLLLYRAENLQAELMPLGNLSVVCEGCCEIRQHGGPQFPLDPIFSTISSPSHTAAQEPPTSSEVYRSLQGRQSYHYNRVFLTFLDYFPSICFALQKRELSI